TLILTLASLLSLYVGDSISFLSPSKGKRSLLGYYLNSNVYLLVFKYIVKGKGRRIRIGGEGKGKVVFLIFIIKLGVGDSVSSLLLSKGIALVLTPKYVIVTIANVYLLVFRYINY
ncbi:hypothetical protein LX36DRAFT_675648, partial [Colletotrichum falcatum]